MEYVENLKKIIQAKKYLDQTLYNGHSLVTYDLLLRILESSLNNKPTTIKEVCTQTTQSMLNTRKHLNHLTRHGWVELVQDTKDMPAIVIRRNKLSSKLWEQIQLAKSQMDGKPFVVMKYKTVKDRETGLRKQVEVPKRIKPWWFQSEQGKVCVSVKYGSWTIELAKGKPSVEVASGEDLIKALESIKSAVETGELDAQIETASASLRSGFKR